MVKRSRGLYVLSPTEESKQQKGMQFYYGTKIKHFFSDSDTFFFGTFRHYITLNLMLLPWHHTFHIGHKSQGKVLYHFLHLAQKPS